ncbi:MAG: SIMPL domain-containing protein [Paracoccus sp. (in: a-proteobacteria)]|nr:SIMPL domain-containing protein [Paracoccus sp. (in: a-proteobacteria)]
MFALRTARTGLVALALGSAALVASAQAQDGAQMERVMEGRLSVTAEGSARTAPDMATISLGVTTQAETAAQALADNSTSQRAVIDKLKAEGVEAKDIQTSGLNLSPVQSYSDGKPPVVTGYQVSNVVTVQMRDLDRLGGLLDALVAAGANQVQGISFGRDDAQAAEDEARVDAIAEARRRAEVMAQAAGVRLGPILSISEGTASYGPAPVMMRAEASMGGTPVEQGELTVTAQVNVVFGLLPEAPQN